VLARWRREAVWLAAMAPKHSNQPGVEIVAVACANDIIMPTRIAEAVCNIKTRYMRVQARRYEMSRFGVNAMHPDGRQSMAEHIGRRSVKQACIA